MIILFQPSQAEQFFQTAEEVHHDSLVHRQRFTQALYLSPPPTAMSLARRLQNQTRKTLYNSGGNDYE